MNEAPSDVSWSFDAEPISDKKNVRFSKTDDIIDE